MEPERAASTRDGPPRPSSDWFSGLFGFREENYDEARRWLKVRASGGRCHLQSVANNQMYDVGVFETPSLGELRERGAAVSLRGHLTVRNELGDVAAKHVDPDNRYALFQVASQFNCLEFPGPNYKPEDGITAYTSDRTQGPACSVACGPATAFRNYFVPIDASGRVVPQSEAVQEGQTCDKMIDNLVDFSELVGNQPIGKLFDMVGGYTMANNAQLKALNDHMAQLSDRRYDELLQSIRVGLHSDVQVTSSVWGTKLVDDPRQVVTQVFGSACAVAYNRASREENWEGFASAVLEASYEATLWAAALNACNHRGKAGSRRVFLTCLGGGVFGNSMDWIYRAMLRAFEKFRDYDLDVRIVTYAGRIDPLLEALERDFPPSEQTAP